MLKTNFRNKKKTEENEKFKYQERYDTIRIWNAQNSKRNESERSKRKDLEKKKSITKIKTTCDDTKKQLPLYATWHFFWFLGLEKALFSTFVFVFQIRFFHLFSFWIQFSSVYVTKDDDAKDLAFSYVVC